MFSGLSGPVCLLSDVRKPRSVFGPASTLLADGAGHLGWFLLSDHQALASATVVQISEPWVVQGVLQKEQAPRLEVPQPQQDSEWASCRDDSAF